MKDGLVVGESIQDYSIKGKLVFTHETTSETVLLSLPHQGVYILKVGNASRKFLY